jgi:regulator of cell morphogenesis and NO signaling
MQIAAEKTVRDLALEIPGATRVLEKLGIDYCCGGARPINEACQAAGVTLEEIAQSLSTQAATQPSADSRDWMTESLSALITHIVEKHHVFTREELDRIEQLLAKVCSVHGEKRRELSQIQALFAALKTELLIHMSKEENILFPYIKRLEAAISAGLPPPMPMFGSVRNPVRMMMVEHDAAGDVLYRIRLLSGGFNAPADACTTFKTLYQALEGLEHDLHQHIHLENNILFPGAVRMEG